MSEKKTKFTSYSDQILEHNLQFQTFAKIKINCFYFKVIYQRFFCSFWNFYFQFNISKRRFWQKFCMDLHDKSN